MNNLIQKWIIWNPTKQQFVTKSPFNYTSDPSLARIYHNYSDAILTCHNHYNKQFKSEHHPIELRFHFNLDTLKNNQADWKPTTVISGIGKDGKPIINDSWNTAMDISRAIEKDKNE